MNAAQATRLARLLTEAVHPGMCPITARLYPAAEYAGFGDATARILGYEPACTHGPEMAHVRVNLPSNHRDREVYLDNTGAPWVWSTVRVPAEDCPCECADAPPFGGPENCPRHGSGVREIDCFRSVRSAGWEVVDRPHPLRAMTVRQSKRVGDAIVGVDVPVSPATLPRREYVIHEGPPIRDVLAEYRQHRAKAAA